MGADDQPVPRPQPAPKAPGTRLVTIKHADGSTEDRIVEDTPGQTFSSEAPAPKPEKPEDPLDALIKELRVKTMQANLAKGTTGAGDEPISPDDVQGAAQAILSGRMAPSQLSLVGGMGNRGVKFKQAVVAEVNKRDPAFNWQSSEAGYQFGKNTGTQNTVRYIDNVKESLPRLLVSATKLQNGNIRFINQAINAGKNQLNDVNLKAFQTDVLLVADEVAKILQGGGTGAGTSDAKLRQAGQILSTSDSPAAIAAAIREVQALIGFRKDSLTRGTFLDKGAQSDSKTPLQKKLDAR